MDSVTEPDVLMEAVTVEGREPEAVKVPTDAVTVGGRELDKLIETVTVGGKDIEVDVEGVKVPMDTVAVIGSVVDREEVGVGDLPV